MCELCGLSALVICDVQDVPFVLCAILKYMDEVFELLTKYMTNKMQQTFFSKI